LTIWPAHPLDALRIDPIWAQGSVVFTLGMDNILDDVELLIKELPQIVKKLRAMSPLTKSDDINLGIKSK